MEAFYYFVGYRMRTGNSYWPWLNFHEDSTVLSVPFPVRDREDLWKLKSFLQKEIHEQTGQVVGIHVLHIISLQPQGVRNTMSYDKYEAAKQRAREDAERGHPYWWRTPKQSSSVPTEDDEEFT